MSRPARKLTTGEIAQAYSPDGGSPAPPILSPAQLAALCGLSVKTVYQWLAQGAWMAHSASAASTSFSGATAPLPSYSTEPSGNDLEH